MFYQFLIEDQSGAALIQCVMAKLMNQYPDIQYDCKSFSGLGHIPQKASVTEIKTGKLLQDIPQYLRGYNKSLAYIPSVIVVVLDNDKADTAVLQAELEQIACNDHITIDHVFCIAVEETEAWLLGDEDALRAAYPNARLSLLREYSQDSICGTWEKLADIVYQGGYAALKKAASTDYSVIGKKKEEWARTIGQLMDLHNNKSPSFQRFMTELLRRIPGCID